MKILIATTAFPRWKDDFRGIFVYEAARNLITKGFSVKVLAMHNPGAKRYEVLDGIEIFRPQYAPQKWEVLQKESAGIPAAWSTNPLNRLLLLPFLLIHTVAIIRLSKNCDLIHANWTLSAICSWLGSSIHRKKTIVTVQGSDIFQAGKIPVIRKFTGWALSKSAKIIALSTSLANATSKLTTLSEKNIFIVPNGVDPKKFSFSQPSSRENILLFVGSLIERKGGHVLINAMPHVLKNFSGYNLIMIGEGPQHGAWQALINQQNLQENVKMIGVKSQTEIANWMKKASLFIFPSLEEGQGVVLVEALASGLPCVGSNVGGIPDVITASVGKLVPPGDSLKLANIICDILENRSLWESMCFAARERAESVYDWSRITDQLITIYESVR